MNDPKSSFFPLIEPLTIAWIKEQLPEAQFLGGDFSAPLDGFCSAASIFPNALTFILSHKNITPEISHAGAVICKEAAAEHLPAELPKIISAQPQLDFAHLIAQAMPSSLLPARVPQNGPFAPEFPHSFVSVHARLEDDVVVLPGAVIGEGVEIGRHSVIGPHAVIADNCKIGRHCAIGAGCVVQSAYIGDHVILHPGVKIGQDGFGYLPGPKGLVRMPQIGRVIIQDRVELGANSTVDRGTLADTVIGEGAKIDNSVQIAHNVIIGRHAVLCANVGLSGSCVVGDGAMLGGGVGVADHINIGRGAQIAAAAGVMNNVPDGEKWAGAPAQPFRAFFKEQATLRRLAKGNKA